MKTRQQLAVSLAALIAVIGGVFLAPSPADAQDVILSPVPKDPCCFDQFPLFRHLRGHALARVSTARTSSPTSTTSTARARTTAPRPTSAVVGPSWTAGQAPPPDRSGTWTSSTSRPSSLRRPTSHRRREPRIPSSRRQTHHGTNNPSELKVTDASVIQVRLEQPLDGNNLVAGQQLTGRLEADVLGADGEVIAPAGSMISARVGAEDAWDTPSRGQPPDPPCRHDNLGSGSLRHRPAQRRPCRDR